MMDHSVTDAAHPRFKAIPVPPSKVTKCKGFKLALIQLAVCKDKCANINNAVKQIVQAHECGAQIVALPECFNSPYGTKYFNEYAEEIPNGTTSMALSKLASDLNIYIVGGSIPERCNNDLYNTCTVWDNNGSLIAKHRKIHLFDIDIPGKIQFKESDVLKPGNHLTMFEYYGVKIGLGICYDLRFEEMAKIYTKLGCCLLIYPGAFNMTTGPKHWELLGRSRANDNQCWLALVSPARDKNADYVAYGHSCIISPWGEVVIKTEDSPNVLLYDIDLDLVDEVRNSIPIISQRRSDLYDTILHHNISCSPNK